jgi:probable H4MPT-linked C1 transfer pathway protein
MSGILALDVGGANTKAVWLGQGPDAGKSRLLSRPFELWRDSAALSGILHEIAVELGPVAPTTVGVTLTAELSDVFRTKREGVGYVLDTVEKAFDGTPLLALTTAGEIISAAAARTRPLELAAANWMATALLLAAEHRNVLIVDVGSTTADIIPIVGHHVAATGTTDLDRLIAGELVYTGALRTTLSAIAARVPVAGGWCPLSSEQFAITADIHLILGHIAPEAYTCPTPDGRPATVAHARERVARVVCADLDQLRAEEVDSIVAHLHAEQVRQLEEAIRQVGSRAPRARPILPLGSGGFLAREAASRMGRVIIEPPARWGGAGAQIGPAMALAELLAQRLDGSC